MTPTSLALVVSSLYGHFDYDGRGDVVFLVGVGGVLSDCVYVIAAGGVTVIARVGRILFQLLLSPS